MTPEGVNPISVINEQVIITTEIIKTGENFLYSETSDQQEERIRKNSKYGELKSWRLFRIIIKSGDDLR